MKSFETRKLEAPMPRIFDNLASGFSLMPALQETLALSSGADFSVGCFNLRGWCRLAQCENCWSAGQGELKERGCA